MAKYSRVQLIFTCFTCQKVIRFSLSYGQKRIWNNDHADKLASWLQHHGHHTKLEYEFFIGDTDTRPNPKIIDMPRQSDK